jgi:DNA processing protein
LDRDVITPEDINAVALSLLRPGPDTVACRLFKREPAGPLELAHQMGLPDAAGAVSDARRRADALLQSAVGRGLRWIAARTPAYPARLTEIDDPPIVLWSRGTASFDARSVAIVGARRATPAGLMMARKLGGDLAAAGWTIVSGMALGIDGAAHEAALDAGGMTWAVLSCGVDIVYPQEHRVLASRIAGQGCLLSEFPPGATPRPWHFPLRNRIISGLAQAVVVVEASEKSGSLITARLAMEQGRDVLAVPGSAASGRYRGSHALIRDGARLVETMDDVLDELEGVSRVRPSHRPATMPESGTLEAVMAVGEPYSVDDLAAATGRSASDLLAELGMLEVAGRIARAGGGNFVRLDGAASVR